MSVTSPDKTFINMLLEETYKTSGEEEVHSNGTARLSDYFEQRNTEFKSSDLGLESTLENYLIKNNLKHFEVEYVKSISCYRMKINHISLDFPASWSIFSSIHKSSKLNNIIHINRENDYDYLLQVVSPFSDYKSEILFFKNDESLFLIFLPENNPKYLKWFNNYQAYELDSFGEYKLAA